MKRAMTLISLLLPLAAAGCFDADEKICDIGDSQRCDCDVGPRGFQICAITEDEWTDCSCIPNPRNATPVTVGGLEMQTEPATMTTWAEAVSLCEADTEGGNSDWRLPTREELSQGFTGCEDQGGGLQLCEPCDANDWCTGAPPAPYWTSTAGGAGEHVAVHPDDASLGGAWSLSLPDDYLLPVICVRAP